MSLHAILTGPNNIHTILAFTYANYSDMTGASGFQSTDIGKVAFESDNGTYWILSATTPTWVPLGSSSQVSATLNSSTNTLGVLPSIYWVEGIGGDSYNANLPNPALMTNRTLVFVSYGYSESNFTILPYDSELIQGGSSYAFNGPGASVTMLCDGTNWFITASASNY